MEGKLVQQVKSRFPERSMMISGRNEATDASPAVRASLRSAGLHIAALRALGREYSDAEYIRAVTQAEELGVGEAYERRVAGAVDEGPGEVGGDLHTQAMRRLQARGIGNPDYAEYRDALVEVSS
jgi:hypothetical protein